MSNYMLQQDRPIVNVKRFVAPMSEYDTGKELYKRGKDLTECVTDDMAAGWLDAERAGADAYWRCMMMEVVN